jgi:hypothetical protein
VYLDAIKREFAMSSGIAPEDIVGCTQEEVLRLEELLDVRFPAYREWLLWMGHRAGRFLRGTAVFYDTDLPSLKEGALELFHANDLDGALPADALVFYLHQGYIVQFMPLSEGNDPPIYGYAQGAEQRAPIRWYDTLSAWIAAELAAHLRWTRAR